MGIMELMTGGSLDVAKMINVDCAVCTVEQAHRVARIRRDSADPDALATLDTPAPYAVIVLGTPLCVEHAGDLLITVGVELPERTNDLLSAQREQMAVRDVE